EMRVTRPTMNLSSMASPTTSTWALPVAPAIRRARSGVTAGSSMVRSRRRERQRDDDEEEHQEFGVAEVVLEHARGEHRGHGGERRPWKHPVGTGAEQTEDADGQRGDAREPDRERRQPALRG